jgi:hypothetical protein
MFTWVYHGLPYKRGAFTHKTDNLELIDLSIYLMVKMMVKTMVPTYDFPQQIHPLNSQEALAALAFVAGWPAKKKHLAECWAPVDVHQSLPSGVISSISSMAGKSALNGHFKMKTHL